MKRGFAIAALFLVLATGVSPALGAEQTVRLSIEMWCASCPYIVQRSLERVPGVAKATASYDDQAATVTFDDAQTNVAALMAATAAVGFPATLSAAN
jgi:mercuric ion binding protein